MPVAAVRPLRGTVLRPGLPADAAVWAGDDEPAALHLAAYGESAEPIGVVTLLPAPYPGPGGPEPVTAADRPPAIGEAAYQLRGMAVAPALTGRGLGGVLLAAALDALRERGTRLVWCNARVSAAGFYAKHGFVRHGEEFPSATPPVPHLRMWRRLAAG